MSVAGDSAGNLAPTQKTGADADTNLISYRYKHRGLLHDLRLAWDHVVYGPCPKPPFYSMRYGFAASIQLVGDGTYDSCMELLNRLSSLFGATFQPRMEHPSNTKGYWDVQIEEQPFLLIRFPGVLSLGAEEGCDRAVFLKVAQRLGAPEWKPKWSWRRT